MQVELRSLWGLKDYRGDWGADKPKKGFGTIFRDRKKQIYLRITQS